MLIHADPLVSCSIIKDFHSLTIVLKNFLVLTSDLSGRKWSWLFRGLICLFWFWQGSKIFCRGLWVIAVTFSHRKLYVVRSIPDRSRLYSVLICILSVNPHSIQAGINKLNDDLSAYFWSCFMSLRAGQPMGLFIYI